MLHIMEINEIFPAFLFIQPLLKVKHKLQKLLHKKGGFLHAPCGLP